MSGLKQWGLAALAALLVAVPADVGFAQVHPLARPLPPVKDRKPKPKPPEPQPKPEPAMSEVVYLPAADVPDLPKRPRRYRPPTGFGGFEWDATRSLFTRLPEQPLSVRAAWTRGMARPMELYCTESPLFASCTVMDVLNNMNPRMEGGGFHVLSEYQIQDQGFRFSETGVLLFPVIYQFCANWDSTQRVEPANFGELNRFCGMRLLFETEALSQLLKLPADHVTQFDLVLAELIAEYGKPAGFIRRGRVSIELLGENEDVNTRGERKFNTWRWCPALDRAANTSCDASIVLSMDAELGRGVVLFATPRLWQYAYARENGHAKGDPLFALMHARQPHQKARR